MRPSYNNELSSCISFYLTGLLHAELLMIRNDLHMGDSKAALQKVNDAIKLIDEKVGALLYNQKVIVDDKQDNSNTF